MLTRCLKIDLLPLAYRKSLMSKLLYAGLGLIGLAIAAWFFVFKSDAPSEAGGFTLETAKVERGEVAQIVSASGR